MSAVGGLFTATPPGPALGWGIERGSRVRGSWGIGSRWGLWLVLVGCGQPRPLSETPIHGGTAAQRAVVAEGLEQMERWTGPDRIWVRGIRLKDLSDADHGGTYATGTRGIVVGSDRDDAGIRRTLRHELCHAFDHQGRISRISPAVGRLAEEVRSDPDHPLYQDLADNPNGPHRWDWELFAQVCSFDVVTRALVEVECADRLRLAELATLTRETVYLGDTGIAAPRRQLTWLGSWPASDGMEELTAAGHADLPRARLFAWGPGGDQLVDLDLWTGAPVATLVAFDTDPIFDVALPVPLPGLDYEPEPAGITDLAPIQLAVVGDRALFRTPRAWGTGDSEHLLLAEDGQWSAVRDACLPEPSTVFVAAGQFYVAWLEDGALHWGSVGTTGDPVDRAATR